jgi:hypothetical protein
MKNVNVPAGPNTIPAHCVIRRIGPADLKHSLTKGNWLQTIGVVSFLLLLDRNVGVAVAVHTSVRAVLANPLTMALWGLIVAASLVIGFMFGGAKLRPQSRYDLAYSRVRSSCPWVGDDAGCESFKVGARRGYPTRSPGRRAGRYHRKRPGDRSWRDRCRRG